MNYARSLYTSVGSGLAVAVVACLVALVVFPLKYGAEARLLITPRATPGVDPYTSSKAAERIAQNLAEVVGTSQFFSRVIAVPGSGIDVSYFPTDELQRRKLWSQTIDASVTYNTGILGITAYHTNKAQAVAIASTVAGVLGGTGNDFAVNAADYRLIDSPVASQYPQKPNFLAIAVAGFLLGGAVSFIYSLAHHKHGIFG